MKSGSIHDLLPGQAGTTGVYARGRVFESIIAGLTRAIDRLSGDDGAEALRFPPVMSLETLRRNGYFVGFPHLAGCIHSFQGDGEDHKRLLYQFLCDEPIGETLAATGLVLTPAACYPAYPLIAGRSPLSVEGVLLDVESYCFRHEPSEDPARMQSFRMREFVRIGSAAQVAAFREGWLTRAVAFIHELALEGEVAAAHDPFFGAGAANLVAGQSARAMKFEMLIPVTTPDRPTACMSFNDHETHFASVWSIRQADGALAHTGCVGFGLERLALALIVAHGSDPDAWPPGVRARLEMAE